MQLEALQGSPIGQLVEIKGTDRRGAWDYWAFLPAPLPTSLDLCSQTWHSVVAAQESLARLDQAMAHVPNPRLLRRPTIRREAQGTSALEGTYAPLDEVMEAEVAELAPRQEVREILNYIAVHELACDLAVDRPISVHMLCELQRRLVEGTASDSPDAGRIRDRQVIIGAEGAPIEQSRFVPPPPGLQLEAAMHDWEAWMNNPPQSGSPPVQMSIVVQAALAHYQFETLHPFSNGNGRLGRLVIALQLMRSGTLREAAIAISPWLQTRRTEYQDHLLRISETGDFEPWIQFLTAGFVESAQVGLMKIENLLEFQRTTKEFIRAHRVRGVAGQIAEDLIGNPILTVRRVARNYGCTYEAANTAVKRLCRLGILRETTGRSYGRVFANDTVLGITTS